MWRWPLAEAEALLVYAIVAAAAGWTVWKVLLPRSVKTRLRGRKPTKAKGECGDGGCENCSD